MKKTFLFILALLSIIVLSSSVYSITEEQGQYNADFVTTTNYGMQIATNQTIFLSEVIKDNTDLATTCQIYAKTGVGTGNFLSNGTFVGNNCELASVVEVNTSVNVYLMGYAGSSVSFTVAGCAGNVTGYLTWVSGVDGTINAPASETTRCRRIVGAVFELPASEGVGTNLSTIYTTESLSASVFSDFGTNMNFSSSLDGAAFLSIANNTNLTSTLFSSLSIGTHNVSFKGIKDGITYYNNKTFEVQPFQYFRFNDTASNLLLTDYTFGGVSSNGTYVTLDTRDFVLGSQTLQFEKVGYASKNFTFILNNTVQINITYNVSSANIVVNIFDRLGGTVLSGVNVTVQILTIGTQTTTTGIATFQNSSFGAGSYFVSTSSDGFYTDEQIFIYTGDSNSTVNVFLLSLSQNNSASLIVPTTDEWDNVLSNVDTRLTEYDQSILGYKQVSQCISNSNGECQYLIEVGTKKYIILGTVIIAGNTYTAQSSIDGETFQPLISGGQEIVGEEYIRQLKLQIGDTLPTSNFYGLYITAPPDENATILSMNSTATVIYIPVTYQSVNNLAYTICLDIFLTSGNSYTSVSSICDTGSSGILPTVNITLNNDFDYEAVISTQFNDITYTYQTYVYPNDKSFSQVLLSEAIVNNAVMLFWVILLGGSMYLRNLALWVWGSSTLAVVQLAIYPNILVGLSSVVIILISMGVAYISKKQVDTV